MQNKKEVSRCTYGVLRNFIVINDPPAIKGCLEALKKILVRKEKRIRSNRCKKAAMVALTVLLVYIRGCVNRIEGIYGDGK